MLIKCKFNLGKNVPFSSRYPNEADGISYSFLEIGAEYSVYGLMFLSRRVEYLVCPESVVNPVWIPADLCEVIDEKLPTGWCICITSLNNDFKWLRDQFHVQSLIGYSELVTDTSHYIGILEREASDLKRFFIEKIKIDAEVRTLE